MALFDWLLHVKLVALLHWLYVGLLYGASRVPQYTAQHHHVELPACGQAQHRTRSISAATGLRRRISAASSICQPTTGRTPLWAKHIARRVFFCCWPIDVEIFTELFAKSSCRQGHLQTTLCNVLTHAAHSRFDVNEFTYIFKHTKQKYSDVYGLHCTLLSGAV